MQPWCLAACPRQAHDAVLLPPLQAAILRGMRDKNIVQFVGVCMGSEEEGQPDEAMMVRFGGWGCGHNRSIACAARRESQPCSRPRPYQQRGCCAGLCTAPHCTSPLHHSLSSFLPRPFPRQIQEFMEAGDLVRHPACLCQPLLLQPTAGLAAWPLGGCRVLLGPPTQRLPRCSLTPAVQSAEVAG